jgi:hypothetical protein
MKPIIAGLLIVCFGKCEVTKEARQLRRKQMHLKNIVRTFIKVDWILKFINDHV